MNQDRPDLEFFAISKYGFEETVAKLQEAAPQEGFTVLHTHEISKIMANKGFHREPITIVEVCSAKHAHSMLAEDLRVALILPCPLVVAEVDGVTRVYSMSVPKVIRSYDRSSLIETAEQIDATLHAILSHVST